MYGSLVGLGAAIVLPTYFYSLSKKEQFNSGNKEPTQLNKKLIKDFVIAAHSKLALVKEMVNEYPNLIYAAYDWGNGDYEEAIEGAAHMGNKEIVNFFIDNGARANLFALTMLGKMNLVKPILENYPKLLYAKGPHGLTLLHHAQVGGARDLEGFLMAQGLTKRMIKIK